MGGIKLEVSQGIKEKVREQRINQIEVQIADIQISIAIYEKLVERFNSKEDQQLLETEKRKLERNLLAFEATKEA
jgi:hypothetical protein